MQFDNYILLLQDTELQLASALQSQQSHPAQKVLVGPGAAVAGGDTRAKAEPPDCTRLEQQAQGCKEGIQPRNHLNLGSKSYASM